MGSSAVYTHPTFRHFLRFHLGSQALAFEDEEKELTVRKILRALEDKSFPFRITTLKEDVYMKDKQGVKKGGITLICTKGESTRKAITFLIEKISTDKEHNNLWQYGPLVIEATRHTDVLIRYYDQAVRSTFRESLARALYADPTTLTTSWYGIVNAHGQKRYLDEVIDQLVHLKGISTLLTSQLCTPRGEMILTDSVRAASLAVSLIHLINDRASDRLVHTVGCACMLQHFGALVDEEETYYAGKLYETTNESTLDALAKLGFLATDDEKKQPLTKADVDLNIMLHLVRYRCGPIDELACKHIALVYCVSLANLIVSTYFTEQRMLYTEEEPILGYNPCFGSAQKTLEKLDAIFADAFFYHYHRPKIERFIKNADRYYRLHLERRISEGSYVSKAARDALGSGTRYLHSRV